MNKIFEAAMLSLVSVCVLFVLTRMMGKRQISQLTFFDYVVGISIGGIAAELAANPSTGYVEGLTGMFIYALFPILLSYISLKSFFGRKLLDGEPTILIQDGKILENNLQKTKMNINDLLEECRLKDVFNISEVEFAILETNGKLSLLLKSNNQSSTLKGSSQSIGLCINIIIDGKILKENLRCISKDEKWVYSQLENKGINNYSKVLLAFLDSSHKFHIYLKNETSSCNIML